MPNSYGQRKYFNTWMKLARLNETFVEYWMGHAQVKFGERTFIPPVKEQLRLYKLAEGRLEP